MVSLPWAFLVLTILAGLPPRYSPVFSTKECLLIRTDTITMWRCLIWTHRPRTLVSLSCHLACNSIFNLPPSYRQSILCTISSIIRFSSRERLSLHSNSTRMTITIDAIPLEFLSGYLSMEFWWLPFQPSLIIKRPWQTGDCLTGALWIPYSLSPFYRLRSPWSEDVSVHQLLIINNSQLCLKIPPPRHHLRVVYDLNFLLHSTFVRTHPICTKPLQDVCQPPPNVCVIFFHILLHLCHPLGND